jgi:hypothetical protein
VHRGSSCSTLEEQMFSCLRLPEAHLLAIHRAKSGRKGMCVSMVAGECFAAFFSF